MEELTVKRTAVTTDELAALLRVSRPQILKWRQEGLPYFKIGQRQYRYDYDKVVGWLRKAYGQGE